VEESSDSASKESDDGDASEGLDALDVESEARLSTIDGLMANLLIASEEILKSAAANAAIPDAKRQALINWTEFNKSYGEKLEQGDHTLGAPYEKEQWILRQVNKLGRKRETAETLGPRSVQRDNLGFAGGVRLWLPKAEYSEKVHSKFTQGAAV
jgi:hypothetical protein